MDVVNLWINYFVVLFWFGNCSFFVDLLYVDLRLFKIMRFFLFLFLRVSYKNLIVLVE